jgi:MoaA/NifB/PqqE/SkfB family radical SAM enzyme
LVIETADNDKPFVVVVRVNTHCSLGCLYCGFSRNVQRSRSAIDPRAILRFARSLLDYQQSIGRSVMVSLLGGEPLQWSAWETVSLQLVQLGLKVSATTNGLALENPRTAIQVIQCFDEITFSIDGERQSHDLLRAAPGMHQRLEHIVRGIVDLRVDRKPLVRVNSVLTRHNIEHFESFAYQMADWGVEQLTFNQLGGNDRPSFYPDNRLLETQVRKFRDAFPRWKSDLRRMGLDLLGSDGYLHRIECTSRNEAIAIDDCGPATDFLFVDEFGRTSPCSFTSDALGVDIDTLTSAVAIESLTERWQQQRKQSRPKACDDCHATHIHSKFVQLGSKL